MHISVEYKILIYAACALLMSLIVGTAVLIHLIPAAQNADKWETHSDIVQAAAAETRTDFLRTQTMGRYAMFDGDMLRQLKPAQSGVLQKIDALSEMVGDNETQTENANTLRKAVIARFQTQENSAAAIQVIGGQVVSNKELAIAGNLAEEKVTNAFAAFALEEKNLSTGRNAEFRKRVWLTIYWLCGCAFVALTSAGVAIYWNWKNLKIRGAVAADLRNIAQDSSAPGASDEQLQILINKLEQAA